MEKFFLGFNRKERKDGTMVAKRIIKHISHGSVLLIYSVQKVHKSGLMDR